MSDRNRELARVRNIVLLFSAGGWILLLTVPGAAAHCAMRPSAESWRAWLRMLFVMNSPAALVTGWGVMLLAMMGPALIAPIYHVWIQSFQRRRAGAIALFLAGYAFLWLPAGVVMLGIEITARALAPQWYGSIAAVFVALAWQLSPWKQTCLNRGHLHHPLAPFGFAAYRDAFRFGITHGSWCIGSCWALMLFPMLLPRGHVAAMATAGALVFSERMERPAAPSWTWRFSGKLARMVVAQTRMHLRILLERA